MAYLLLGIENVALWLIFAAIVIAGFRLLRHRRFLRGFLRWSLLLVPVVFYLALLAGYYVATGFYASFDRRSAGGVISIPLLLLLIVYIVGAAMLWRAGRKPGATAAYQSDEWSRPRLALAFFVVLTFHVLTFWNLDSAAREHVAVIDSEARQLALWAAPTRPLDSDNAAQDYLAAASAIEHSGDWPESWREKWLGPWSNPGGQNDIPFDPVDPELSDFLAYHTGALAAIERGTTKTRCFFDRDFVRPNLALLLPELGQLRACARLIAVAARHDVAKGNSEMAIKRLNQISILSRHIAEEPFLISLLVTIAIDDLACQTLEDILPSLGPNVNLTTLTELADRESYRRKMGRALMTEEALGLRMFHEVFGEGRFKPFQLSEYDLLAAMDASIPSDPFGFSSAYRVFFLAGDVAEMRHSHEVMRTLMAEPYGESTEKWKMLNARKRSGLAIMTSLLTPAIQSGNTACTRGDARRELTRTAVACVGYRQRNGKDPESIDALVREAGIIPPRDPFDGKLIRMKKADEGLLLYSIGPNLVDNGGEPLDKEKGTDDEGFKLRPFDSPTKE